MLETGCPRILSYGGSETEEFKRQSEDYASAWQSAGFEAESFEVSECNHFDILLELTKSSSVLTSKLLGLVQRGRLYLLAVRLKYANEGYFCRGLVLSFDGRNLRETEHDFISFKRDE